MRGTMQRVNHGRTPIFRIHGEDDVWYFTSARYLVNDNWFEKFCWNGNGVTFDPQPPREGYIAPSAVNVVPDFVPDPNWESRRAHRLVCRQRKKEAEERRKKTEIKLAEAQRIADVKSQYKTYIVQIRTGDVWKHLMPYGEPLAYDTVPEAKEKIAQLKKAHPDMRFRVVDRWKELKRTERRVDDSCYND